MRILITSALLVFLAVGCGTTSDKKVRPTKPVETTKTPLTETPAAESARGNSYQPPAAEEPLVAGGNPFKAFHGTYEITKCEMTDFDKVVKPCADDTLIIAPEEGTNYSKWLKYQGGGGGGPIMVAGDSSVEGLSSDGYTLRGNSKTAQYAHSFRLVEVTNFGYTTTQTRNKLAHSFCIIGADLTSSGYEIMREFFESTVLFVPNHGSVRSIFHLYHARPR
jgi:hypothetical protein